MNKQTPTSLSAAELPERRRQTELISRFLRGQVAQHLETLRPVFEPERLLGKFAGGKADLPGAERAMTELRDRYRDFAAAPYNLGSELDPHCLTLIGRRLELFAWEYEHTAKSGQDTKTLTLTSPNRWIVNYSVNFPLAPVKLMLAGREARRPDLLRQWVVNALVLRQVVDKTAGISSLFAALRYTLKIEQAPDLPRLPLVVIEACIPSIRPADDLMLNAAALSGIPAFIELSDLNAIQPGQDPLKLQIDQLLKGK